MSTIRAHIASAGRSAQRSARRRGGRRWRGAAAACGTPAGSCAPAGRAAHALAALRAARPSPIWVTLLFPRSAAGSGPSAASPFAGLAPRVQQVRVVAGRLGLLALRGLTAQAGGPRCGRHGARCKEESRSRSASFGKARRRGSAPRAAATHGRRGVGGAGGVARRRRWRSIDRLLAPGLRPRASCARPTRLRRQAPEPTGGSAAPLRGAQGEEKDRNAGAPERDGIAHQATPHRSLSGARVPLPTFCSRCGLQAPPRLEIEAEWLSCPLSKCRRWQRRPRRFRAPPSHSARLQTTPTALGPAG